MFIAAPSVCGEIDPRRLFTGLAGQWQGALEYRDYQSNRLERLPVAVQFSTRGDEFIQKAVFQELGDEIVTLTVATFDAPATRRQVSFTRGGSMESYAETVRLPVAPRSISDWTVVLERRGLDNDRPALIRETVVRRGSQLRWEKQVDLTTDAAGFLFRHRIVLAKTH